MKEIGPSVDLSLIQVTSPLEMYSGFLNLGRHYMASNCPPDRLAEDVIDSGSLREEPVSVGKSSIKLRSYEELRGATRSSRGLLEATRGC